MQVKRKGQSLELEGIQPKVGEKAPDFSLNDLHDHIISLADCVGKPVLISVVPDIDTRICSLQTKHFNQEAASVADVMFLTISNNTKNEQANWCAAEGVDMEILRDTDGDFGKKYGLFIPEMGRLARAIFVINKEGTLIYEAISDEISEEPDYKTAMNVAKAAR